MEKPSLSPRLADNPVFWYGEVPIPSSRRNCFAKFRSRLNIGAEELGTSQSCTQVETRPSALRALVN